MITDKFCESELFVFLTILHFQSMLVDRYETLLLRKAVTNLIFQKKILKFRFYKIVVKLAFRIFLSPKHQLRYQPNKFFYKIVFYLNFYLDFKMRYHYPVCKIIQFLSILFNLSFFYFMRIKHFIKIFLFSLVFFSRIKYLFNSQL